MRLNYILIIVISLSFNLILKGQGTSSNNRIAILEQKLEDYSLENINVDKKIDISITGTIQEFALAFSKETKVNLTVSPQIKQAIASNFSDTRPKDILLYLCRTYELDLRFSGSIISLIPHKAPPTPKVAKPLNINFNKFNNQIALSLERDTLGQVVRAISMAAGVNVICTKDINNQLVNGFIGFTEFEKALDQFAKSNELIVLPEEDGYYVITKKDQSSIKQQNEKKNRRNKGSTQSTSGNNYTIESTTDSLNQTFLTIKADDIELSELIKKASIEAAEDYVLLSQPTGKITLDIEKVSFQEFLNQVLQGTNLLFKKRDNFYLIGDNTVQILTETEVYQFQHRSVKEIDKIIPVELLTNVKVTEFIEMNSLIIAGSQGHVSELKLFLDEIDRAVPVVTIELTIVDVNTNSEINMGLELGTADAPVQPGGILAPGVDFTFSSKGINEVLGLLAGNGIINLGKVNPNFYATLQAVEENGHAKVRSKPRLSTLNGKEAEFTLGETRYYQIQRTTLQGNQSPITLQDRNFESVNADFTIKILPVISGDENVTLAIEVKQSDFIGQIQSDAPPGQINRSFVSNIRVKNQEMIVLGGIESKSIEESGRGLPWISRIPVIRWFFSKRRKARKKTQLLIFVRPTIIY